MKVNIGNIFAKRADLSPNVESYVGENYRLTYKEANKMTNQLSHYLRKLPIYPGDRIAIMCKNKYQCALTMFAAAKIGAVLVPMNWRLAVPEMEYILNNSGATLLLFDKDLVNKVDQLRSSTQLRYFIRIGGSDGSDIEFAQTLARQPDYEPELTSGDDDTAIIIYTSGTTGTPKGAMISHYNLYSVCYGKVFNVSWALGERYMSLNPFFHIGGLAPLLNAVLSGCTVILMEKFDPVKAWQIIVKERVTSGMAVPSMLKAMLEVPDIDKMDISCLKHITCAGSNLSGDISTKCKKLNIEIDNAYGMTECSGSVSFWTNTFDWDTRDSIGKPLMNVSIKIVDPKTREEMPTGVVGEIACFGPQVFKGYWNNPIATRKVKVDDWYFTGDLGMKDNDGFFHIVDRMKHVIVSGGENVYPAEIERVIKSISGVSDVAVVRKRDEKWYEVPAAFVVKAPGNTITEEDITKECSCKLAKFKVPKEVIFTDFLPRNAAGKVQKQKLEELIENCAIA